ncbi:MAG: hypothetical protein HDR24_08425 [Lachnospiraceae bacterium]|nr:hypothetical protein [Lachnospiraceae bacterium]
MGRHRAYGGEAVKGKGLLLVSGLWRKIGNFTYGMVDTQGSPATDGGTRSHKAGCRLAPTRSH